MAMGRKLFFADFLMTSSSLGSLTPLLVSLQCMAGISGFRSSWLHLKVQRKRRPRKIAYFG